MTLTPKQERLVAEYVIDLNATRAAVRAGYSAKSAEVEGSRLLRNAKVAEAVAEAARKHTLRAEITAQDVIDRLWAEGDPRRRRIVSQRPCGGAWPARGKYHSLFIDRTEVTVTHRLADLSDEELMEEIRRRLAGEEQVRDAGGRRRQDARPSSRRDCETQGVH